MNGDMKSLEDTGVGSSSTEFTLRKQCTYKRQKKKPNIKAARLIVRNLPFKAKEEDVKEHFSCYGNVLEVKLLKKGDKMVGCGFVQFDCKWSAAKAIAKTSGKLFQGRTIVVDWAVAKNHYKKHDTEDEGIQIKSEIKEEVNSDSDERDRNDGIHDTSKEYKFKAKFAVKEESNEINSTFMKRNEKKFELKNAEDGHTLFFKNIPFNAENSDLEECVRHYGKVDYALICMDPATEHSKGSGFVRFKEKSSADACLNSTEPVVLKGYALEVHKAISKEKLHTKNSKEKIPKDKRNLYLAKEGVVLPGSPASNGISNADMAKRLELENWKSQKLRNLNMFVSRTRLIIHNLPSSVNDRKLREIVHKNCSNVPVCEAKVMLYLNQMDGKGIPKSKGYGFLGFKTHEDALTVLRLLNNNPTVFSKARRPIISFSIENLKAVKAKEARYTSLKKRNEKVNLKKAVSTPVHEFANTSLKIETEQSKYEGLTAKLGSKKLFSKYNLKIQAQKHITEMKKLKTKLKNKPKRTRKKDIKGIKAQAVPKRAHGETSGFPTLVEKYKSQISQCINRKKWYE